MTWSGRQPQKPVIRGLPPVGELPPRYACQVECPKCGAAPLHPCHTPTGYVARTHRDRWRAVGIDNKERILESLVEDHMYAQKLRGAA